MSRICEKCGTDKPDEAFANPGSRGCLECHRAKRRARYADPTIKARIKEQQAAYRAKPGAAARQRERNVAYWQKTKHAEHAKAMERRERRHASPEYIAAQEERKRRTAENYRLHRRIMQSRRRARLRLLGRNFTRADIEEIYLAQRKRCAICAAPLRRKFHIDHIIPLARGGANGRENIQLACADCNWKKRAKDPLDFMRELGRLL